MHFHPEQETPLSGEPCAENNSVQDLETDIGQHCEDIIVESRRYLGNQTQQQQQVPQLWKEQVASKQSI
jgi:hypothetical protein